MKYVFVALFILAAQTIFSQDIEIDKNGLVRVDGKDSFYLVKKNKSIFGFDLSLQNLQKEELAFFLTKDTKDLPWSQQGSHTGNYYQLTFKETANTANIFPETFNVVKQIAKLVINTGLMKDHHIDPKAEKALVVSHDGRLNRDNSEKVQITVNTAAPQPQKSANILVKNNSIYNNDELIGLFKKNTDANTGITTVTIYNSSDVKVAVATHKDTDPNADWNLTTITDNKTYQVLYTEAGAMEKLFKFLAERSLF